MPSDRPHRIAPVFFLLTLCIAAWVILFGNRQPTPLLTAQVGGGQTYYACDCGQGSAAGCVPGNDANPGTSPSAPIQTLVAVDTKFNALQAGETLALCNGGAWDWPTGTTTQYVFKFLNTRGSAATPLTLTNYVPASGSSTLPIVKAALKFWNSQQKDGYILRNLHFKGDGTDSGILVSGNVRDFLMENLTVDGFGTGIQVTRLGAFVASERVTLRNSRVINNSYHGWLGGAVATLIEDSVFDNNGYRNSDNGYAGEAGSVFFHNMYFAGNDPTAPSGGVIRRNTFTRNAPANGRCRATVVVGHSHIADLVFENNTIVEGVDKAEVYCNGIGFGLLTSGNFTRRITIRNNRIENIGNLGINVNGCEDCVVEGNVIIHQQPFGINAIVNSDNNPVNFPNGPLTQRLIVRNNSIMISGITGNGGSAIKLGSEGAGHQIVGNAVYMGSGVPNMTCFIANMPNTSFTAFDRNICLGPKWALFNSINYTLAQQQQAGFNLHSLATNPLFTSNTDATPQAGSPLIDAGGSGCPSTDITGKSRPQGAACDVGAYEVGSGGHSSSSSSVPDLCLTLTPKRAGFAVKQAVLTLLQGAQTVVHPQIVTVDSIGKACLPSSMLTGLSGPYTLSVRPKMFLAQSIPVSLPAPSSPYALSNILVGDFNDDGIIDLSDLLSFVDYIKTQNNTNFSQVSSSATFSDLLRAIIDAIRQYREG